METARQVWSAAMVPSRAFPGTYDARRILSEHPGGFSHLRARNPGLVFHIVQREGGHVVFQLF